MPTIELIDAHIQRTWLRLKEAEHRGRPTTEYRHIIDTLLDQRIEYSPERTPRG